MSAALLTLFTSSCGAAEVLTEKEVLQRFMEQSPQARELRARIAATKAELQGRSLFPNPSFAYTRESAGFTEFFEAQQQLPITGRLGYLRKASNAAVGATEEEARFSLWRLRGDVRIAFYALLRAQERERVLGASIDEISRMVKILVDREKLGEGSKYDRLRSEREIAELRAERTVAEGLVIEAKMALSSLLPKDIGLPSVAGTLKAPFVVPGAELFERALRARGDLKAEENLVKRFQFEQTAAGKLRIPEPFVSAGLKRADNARGGAVAGPVVSLTVPLPLFNRGTTEVQRFQAEEQRAKARRDLLQQQIEAQVEGAYQSLLLRQRAAGAYEKETSAPGENLMRIVQVAYQEGELGILELLDALRVNRQTQLRLLDLRAAAREAEIVLERVVGEEIEK